MSVFISPAVRAFGLTMTSSAQPGGLQQINHVIVIYQENWSFDSLYGKFPGANGLSRETPADVGRGVAA